MNLLGVLFVVFLVLKLVGAIAWSWWWVTAPLWGIPALFFGGVTLIAMLTAIFGTKRNRRW